MDVGTVDGAPILTGFAGIDYALAPGIDLNLSASVVRLDSRTAGEWFSGMTWRSNWLTFRGGYCYDDANESHRFTIQAYYLFSRGY
jgi:hypothetical protein